MIIYIGEFIGTAIFILIGLSASAIAFSNSYATKISKVLITSIGWSFAYVIPNLAFGEGNGPHLNPAITVSLAFNDLFDKRFVIGYIICQVAGALLGCILFYICNAKRINDETNSTNQLRMFCVWPEEPNVILNLLREIIVTFVFIFGLLNITQVYGIRTEVLYVFYIVVYMAVGVAFDFSEVTCNPVRDVIPRFFHLIMPMKNKGKNHFWYIFITIIGPMVGAYLATYLTQLLPWDTAVSKG